MNQSSFTTKNDRKTNAYGEVGFGFLDNGDEDTEVSFVTKGKFSDKLTELSAMLHYTKKFQLPLSVRALIHNAALPTPSMTRVTTMARFP